LPSRSPEPILNRHPEEHRPLLIGAWEKWSPAATFKIQIKTLLEVVMPSRNEHLRAQARAILERQTPVADDATLLSLQSRVDEIIAEAKRRDPSRDAEVMSTVIDEIRRAYFRHVRRR